jgi:ParB-like chromosome segregation protein Spo0J
MPGYRSLSSNLSGTAAEHAREAELSQRHGDPHSAARLLEEALAASLRSRPEMPGWVCGRLASIYRTLKRYDDEVELLERYRESQTSEEARTRFDARLSKARAIADRKRRPVTGALETVRQVRHRSSQRRRTPSRAQLVGGTSGPATLGVSAMQMELRAALIDRSSRQNERTRAALTVLCSVAHAENMQMEHLVATLKRAWTDAPTPADFTEEEWHERYSAALVELLALYFGEAA